jgi:hypothetical protein
VKGDGKCLSIVRVLLQISILLMVFILGVERNLHTNINTKAKLKSIYHRKKVTNYLKTLLTESVFSISSIHQIRHMKMNLFFAVSFTRFQQKNSQGYQAGASCVLEAQKRELLTYGTNIESFNGINWG